MMMFRKGIWVRAFSLSSCIIIHQPTGAIKSMTVCEASNWHELWQEFLLVSLLKFHFDFSFFKVSKVGPRKQK